MSGRCLPYGEGITYWPSLRPSAGSRTSCKTIRPKSCPSASGALRRHPRCGKRVASAIGLTDDAFSAEEIAWGVRRLIEALAANGPVIMVLDDIHWAERTLLDLAKDLVESVEAPLLLLCGSRRDLLDDHPGWPMAGARARVIDLSPLTQDESNLVFGSLLGAGAADPAVARWLTTAAEGTLCSSNRCSRC